MRRKRRSHTESFEAKITLVAIRGDLTLAERAKLFHMNPDQIHDWPGKGLNDADEVFNSSTGQEKDDLAVPLQRHLVDFFSQPYTTKMRLSHAGRERERQYGKDRNCLPATYPRVPGVLG